MPIDKRGDRSYIPPPLSQRGAKRTVVNLPTDRISKLLESIDAMEAWINTTVELIAARVPDLLPDLPNNPDMSDVEAERMYQQIRGKYNKPNRDRMRFVRAKKELGIPTLTDIRQQRHETDDAASKIISDDILNAEPQRTLAEIAQEMNQNDPLKDLDNVDLTHVRDTIKTAPEPNLSKYTEEELIEMGLVKGQWWCSIHKREATWERQGQRCCDPSLGGIMLPCEVAFTREDQDNG